MKIQAESYIGEIAAQLPQAIPLFQAKGIDYCCGGNQPLWKACAAAGVASGDLVLELERLSTGAGGEGVERWVSLFQLIWSAWRTRSGRVSRIEASFPSRSSSPNPSIV
jgi:iron-sulfur cluster repair protein YtfE (RIC family)